MHFIVCEFYVIKKIQYPTIPNGYPSPMLGIEKSTIISCQQLYLLKILDVIYRRYTYIQFLYIKCSLIVKTGKDVLQNYILNKINKK